ncbi:MAG: hydantoinase/oxoprolinase family protein [Gammaproteobacteria bacterium]|nr:MAG: hydantoinase/oxoprolinase family protein [Gammaproteobacteria bacterium]
MNNLTLVGIDTGGTFTDIVVLEDGPGGGRLHQCKVLSDPLDPAGPIVAGLKKLGFADRALQIIHGTTVATNAVLEGKGARVAYVTSKGFADVLSLGRQEREHVYQLRQPEIQPPVPASRCLEVTTRIIADASLLSEAGDEELARLKARLEGLDIEAVAINLLFSFLQPQAEQRIARALGDRWFVSCSSTVLPEIREYERGIATWLNASVGPIISRYLEQLQNRLPKARVAVMQSAGTTIAANQAAQQAVRLLLSGPAGGLAAARSIGKQTGHEQLMSFDMGGTSTDVALLNGEIPLTGQSRLGRWPLSIPSVDIHTIGAGGGSIAKVDVAGMLLVGPESAGASPGPACYAQGGTEPTVTDANLLLGRIPPNTLLAGYLPLNIRAAETALEKLANNLTNDGGCDVLDAALGVIQMANEHMARALRVISVERGYNPADYTLLCFGGAGGLHACDLAELLNMKRVIVPARSGVLSALGMLVSESGRELSQAVLLPLARLADKDIGQRFKLLEADALVQLQAEGCRPGSIVFRRQLELRYKGQSATIGINWSEGGEHEEDFRKAHARASGLRLPHQVELVNIRLSARAPAALASIDFLRDDLQHAPGELSTGELVFMPELGCEVLLLKRSSLETGKLLQGPLILVETAATVWIKPAWSVKTDKWGNLLLHRKQA